MIPVLIQATAELAVSGVDMCIVMGPAQSGLGLEGEPEFEPAAPNTGRPNPGGCACGAGGVGRPPGGVRPRGKRHPYTPGPGYETRRQWGDLFRKAGCWHVVPFSKGPVVYSCVIAAGRVRACSLPRLHLKYTIALLLYYVLFGV